MDADVAPGSTINPQLSISLKDIEAARARIEGAVYHSPCPHSIPLSEITGMEIYCKLDNLQRTGSFKERGARNALALLPPEQQKRGVIAASAGNHAQALAYQGKLLRHSRDRRDAEIRATHQSEQLPEARRNRGHARQRFR